MPKNDNLKFGWSLVLSMLLGILIIFLLTFAFHLDYLLVFSDVTLTALIQAEATIIGFFGIIFILYGIFRFYTLYKSFMEKSDEE